MVFVCLCKVFDLQGFTLPKPNSSPLKLGSLGRRSWPFLGKPRFQLRCAVVLGTTASWMMQPQRQKSPAPAVHEFAVWMQVLLTIVRFLLTMIGYKLSPGRLSAQGACARACRFRVFLGGGGGNFFKMVFLTCNCVAARPLAKKN